MKSYLRSGALPRPPGRDQFSSIGTVRGLRSVALMGEIDYQTAATACRVFDVIDGPAFVDLSNVRFLSAAGLTQLHRLATRVGPHTVTIINASPNVRRILDLAKFERLFVIE